jgi:hypothetical protein
MNDSDRRGDSPGKKNRSDKTKRRKRDMEENDTPNPSWTSRRVSGVRDSAPPGY